MIKRNEEGFTYLAALFLVAILSASLAGTGVIWSMQQQREKERELLFIGNAFRNAIGTYYQKTPGTIKRYPNSLDDLLKDNRQLVTTRYLRKIYKDPFTGTEKWGLIRAPDGGIMGISSLSANEPIKKYFEQESADFIGTKKYSDWHFVYLPSTNSLINNNLKK
ncbi:type II secretion system protein [Herbaspirillum sp. RV1423]|uniref:type II secretion system protein n=1 Tax=Herbaspirillum sp. RV1423 TaxID=1443993 RepID=UPI0004BC172F|nr:type II secretion system protein [Herbaspirillum sp. RV1423]